MTEVFRRGHVVTTATRTNLATISRQLLEHLKRNLCILSILYVVGSNKGSLGHSALDTYADYRASQANTLDTNVLNNRGDGRIYVNVKKCDLKRYRQARCLVFGLEVTNWSYTG